jgi:transcriptional regulator with XRE-family HTH domain
MSEFRFRLQELLDEHGIKAVDLANAIDAPKARISQWMNGKTKPNSNSLYQVAKYFNVSEGWLLGADVPKTIDRQRLEQKVEICEMVEQCYGTGAREAVRKFLLLNDQGQQRIVEEIDLLLQSPKYTLKGEESSEKKAI